METRIAPISEGFFEDGIQMYVDIFLEGVKHCKH